MYLYFYSICLYFHPASMCTVGLWDNAPSCICICICICISCISIRFPSCTIGHWYNAPYCDHQDILYFYQRICISIRMYLYLYLMYFCLHCAQLVPGILRLLVFVLVYLYLYFYLMYLYLQCAQLVPGIMRLHATQDTVYQCFHQDILYFYQNVFVFLSQCICISIQCICIYNVHSWSLV